MTKPKKNLLRFLRDALVETDASSDTPTISDTNTLINNLTAAGSIPAVPVSTPVSVFTPEDDLILPEGVPFENIYALANVLPVSYSIERLDKLVEGLNQLDRATQRTAVTAMDAADDSWKIEDVISDGRTKVAALLGYQGDITELEQAIKAEVDVRLNANSVAKAATLKDFDARIAELTVQREQAIAASSTEAANLRATAAAASEAADRERARIHGPVTRFGTLITLFDAPASTASPLTP